MADSSDREQKIPDACVSCGIPGSRRDFLMRAGAAAVGLLVVFGGSEAAALPVRWISSESRANNSLTFEIPTADGASIDAANEVIVVRWQGHLYAFALSCPHQHTALRWNEAEAHFQCPKHKSKYTPDGTFISGRATRGMDRFPISVAGGKLVVDNAHVYKQDKDAAGWASATVAV